MANLSELWRPTRVISIDASTTSLAFAVFKGKRLEKHGKINFDGQNPYYRAGDAAKKCVQFFRKFPSDAIVIEGTIFKNSVKTAMQLALVQGAILGSAQVANIGRIEAVAPLTWQAYIGTRTFTRAEKLAFAKENPGQKTSWYQNKHREMRKQMTIDSVNAKYKLEVSDNDIADAIGIGWYTVESGEVFG